MHSIKAFCLTVLLLSGVKVTSAQSYSIDQDSTAGMDLIRYIINQQRNPVHKGAEIRERLIAVASFRYTNTSSLLLDTITYSYNANRGSDLSTDPGILAGGVVKHFTSYYDNTQGRLFAGLQDTDVPLHYDTAVQIVRTRPVTTYTCGKHYDAGSKLSHCYATMTDSGYIPLRYYYEYDYNGQGQLTRIRQLQDTSVGSDKPYIPVYTVFIFYENGLQVKDSGHVYDKPGTFRLNHFRTHDTAGRIVTWRRDTYFADTIYGRQNYQYWYDYAGRLIQADLQYWNADSNRFISFLRTAIGYSGAYRAYTSFSIIQYNSAFKTWDTTSREVIELNTAGNPVCWARVHPAGNWSWDTSIAEWYSYNIDEHLTEAKLKYFYQQPNFDSTIRKFYYEQYDTENDVPAIAYSRLPVTISPNPAADYFQLSFGTMPASVPLLTIYDAEGKMIQQHRLPMKADVDIPTSQLPPGYYNISVKEGLRSRNLKLIICR